MSEEVKHITVNGKYRIVFERAASANKTDGFKIEANGDDIEMTFVDAKRLYDDAMRMVEANKPQPPAPSTFTKITPEK